MPRRFCRFFGVLMALVLLFVTVPPPAGAQAASPLTQAEAIALLRSYNIVRGDPSGNLGLTDRLTRAQAAALFVRSLGAESLAQLLVDVVPFTDSKGHWASGEIALAERMGLMRGDGNGTFRPDADITYAEVLTVLLRMVQQEPQGTWNPQRIWDAAVRAGIAPAGVQSGSPALRGQIFWSLGSTVARIPLANGQTLLQKHMDSTPPQLVVDNPVRSTQEQTTVISGSVGDGVRVTVAGKPAVLSTATGRFQHSVSLVVGANTFPVEAFDLAGNKSSATVTIERKSNATRIDIIGPGTLPINGVHKLTVAAFDSQNRAVPLTDLQVELTGDVATFSLENTTLTTSARTGTGRLTLKSGTISKQYSFTVAGPSARVTQLRFADVNGGRGLSIGKEAAIQVQVLDAAGQVATDDYGRSVTLSVTGLSGMITSPQTVITQGGVATFSFTGMAEGIGTMTVSSQGLNAASVPVQVLSSTRVVLTASPASLKPDGVSAASIRAVLQNENGQAVTNRTGASLSVQVNASGTDGYLSQNILVIPQNTSSSGTISFHAGILAGTATITGYMQGGQTYSVQALSLPVADRLTGVRLQVVYPTARLTPGGHPAAVTVRVLDAQNRLVTTGAYAFQFAVTTSNNEPVLDGLPEGVELFFPNSSYQPHVIAGRTHLGVATVNLKYNKSGIVTLIPRLIGPAPSAFHPTSGFGPAASSLGMTTESGSVTFAASAARVELTANSALGTDQPGGAGSPGSAMTIRARVVDAAGMAIPGYSESITLTRTTSGNLVTSISGVNRKAAVNGATEFTIQAGSSTGFDTYRATVGTLTSLPITLSVRSVRAETPTIAAIRGVKTGDPSPAVGYVAPDADFMEIQLHPQAPLVAGEPHNWVNVRVFHKGESSPIVTGAVIDLRSDLPVVRIPKSALRAGLSTYEVVVNNAAGDTARSPDLGLSDAVNATYSTSFHLSGALYDAQTGQLTLTTSGLAANGQVNRERLRLVKEQNQFLLGGSDIAVVSVNPGSVILQLGAVRPNPDHFHGSVLIHAEDGWYTSAEGALVARGSQTAPVRPMAVITHATLDVPEMRLTLYGTGFTQGALALDAVKIGSVALKPGTTTELDRVASVTDGQVLINLSQATLDGITGAEGAPYLTAGEGWIRTVIGATTYHGAALEGAHRLIYIRATVTSVQYDRSTGLLTLRGSGFAGATLSPALLSFRAPGTAGEPWRPAALSEVTVTDDTALTIGFSEADASAFEAAFDGRNVFLNTDEGWLVDPQGRTAAPLPVNSVLFSVPV